ncbi:hypothetical protein WG904_07970 [Pedobacter sp. Du54]|uniref:MutS-related protein n=1 Tax=Pedobacter anseongensis TaxID=3133439 RepID=UPI0030B3C193
MNFKMDEQSYRDLSIFKSDENIFSVFDLFKKTKTLGGRELLKYWMSNPSNDINILQRRSAAISFLQKSKIQLQIDHNHVDLILHYLNYDHGYLKRNIIDSFVPWLQNQFKPNQNYYVVQVGITKLLELIKYGGELISRLIENDVPILLQELAMKLKNIIDILNINSIVLNKKLNFSQIGQFDFTFRKTHRLLLLDLLNVFYELDVLEAVANVANTRGFCLPSYTIEKEIDFQIDGLFHPVFHQPNKNSFKIDNNLVFLSGSNMSGKSSLLKAVGLSIYLAHLGFPVPAKRMKTSIFNGLITTINLADTIENGLSHYYSEVIRIKKVATILKERSKMFVIFDELFKGTNAKDAFDASLLVINSFSAISKSIFIISSHITELAAQLNAEKVTFKYMEHQTVDGQPIFTYQLKDGISKDGTGMYFIEKEGIINLLKQAKT